MTAELTKDQKSDAAFIRQLHPGGWPQWPYLPMKRSTDKGLEAGTLMDKQPFGKPLDPNHPCNRTVYVVSVWAVSAGKAKFSTAPIKIYDSVEAMLLDGWEVD